MNYNIMQHQIASRALNTFFTASAETLLALIRDLGIELSPTELQFIKLYFRQTLKRTPIVAELFFAAEFLRVQRRSPASLLPADLQFDSAEIARIFVDMDKKCAALTPKRTRPYSLLSFMDLAGSYLKRAGHAPSKADLYLVRNGEAAIYTGAAAPAASLELGALRAILLTQEQQSPSMPKGIARKPIALCATRAPEGVSLAEITERILGATAPLGARQIAYIGSEGFMPHLQELKGTELFPPLFPDYCAETLFSDFNNMLKNTTLLAIPEETVTALLRAGIPIKPIGRCNESSSIRICYPSVTITLDPHLIKELTILAERLYRAEIKASTKRTCSLALTTTKTDLLCGAIITGNTGVGLRKLIEVAFRNGISSRRIRLTAALSCSRSNLAAAIPMIAELYRLTTELSLASLPARIIPDDAAEPTLTVALAAPLSPMPSEAQRSLFSEAVAREDYQAMRALLYSKAE